VNHNSDSRFTKDSTEPPYGSEGCLCTRTENPDEWYVDGCKIHDPVLKIQTKLEKYAHGVHWQVRARLSAALILAALWVDNNYNPPPEESIERTLLDQGLGPGILEADDLFKAPMDGADFMESAAKILEIARWY
jgi:hypothetical protein